MTHEKDRRAGRTYVEPGELSARERTREHRHRGQADAGSGDQQEPDPASDPVREDPSGAVPRPHSAPSAG